jgi:DNA (cytosine-5)-methyltransferase 1
MTNKILTMNSVELFTGAGGLAIGISNAGFRHQAAIERDKDACFTIRSNQQRGIQSVADWPVFQADVSQFDFTTLHHASLSPKEANTRGGMTREICSPSSSGLSEN